MSATIASTEREELLADLRERLTPGTTVYTFVRSVASSGTSRRFGAFYIHNGRPVSLDWALIRLGIGRRPHKLDGFNVSGAGMDMGFHVVYSLSCALYPDGFHCIGQGQDHTHRCPSNDHANDYGMLTRQYDEDHPGNYDMQGSTEERTAYVSARKLWVAEQKAKLWSPSRIHTDGGYALRQNWM